MLSYSLSGGADKDAFTIDQETGQIEVGDDTKLNFEGDQATYTVEVKAEDPFALSDTIVVTITVTDVDEPPVLGLVPGNTAPKFAAATYTREVAENTVAGMPIGDPVTATDNEGNALTYSMSGDDAASLTIGRTSGQIRTKDALDYETKSRILHRHRYGRRPGRPQRHCHGDHHGDRRGRRSGSERERRGRLRGEWRRHGGDLRGDRP